MKYKNEDFDKIKRKEATIDEIASKYNVSKHSIILAMNKRGIYTQKKSILIKSPFGKRIVSSIQDCADELKISRDSVKRALKGKRVALLEELNIELEVYNGEEKERGIG